MYYLKYKKKREIILTLIKISFSCFSDIVEAKNNLFQYLKHFFFKVFWILQWTVNKGLCRSS